MYVRSDMLRTYIRVHTSMHVALYTFTISVVQLWSNRGIGGEYMLVGVLADAQE